MKKRLYFTYIVTNFTHTVLYTGIPNDLKIRIYSHKNKIGSAFITKYHVDKLVYYEVIEDLAIAIKREKSIKNLVRRKKIALISKFNPGWKDLFASL